MVSSVGWLGCLSRERWVFRQIRDELVGAAIMVALAESNVRWGVQDRLVATDATPGDGGSAEADISNGLEKALYRRGCKSGERVHFGGGGV